MKGLRVHLSVVFLWNIPFFFCSSALPDSIEVRLVPYDNIHFVSVDKNDVVFETSDGKKLTKPLSDVTCFNLDLFPLFSQAENLCGKGQFVEAIQKYQECLEVLKKERADSSKKVSRLLREGKEKEAVSINAFNRKGKEYEWLFEHRLLRAKQLAEIRNTKKDRIEPETKKDTPLNSPENLAKALSQNPATSHSSEMPGWESKTSLQQENTLREHEEKTKAEQHIRPDYRGQEVDWTIRVEDISEDREKEGYRVVGRSETGLVVTVLFPANNKDSLLKIAKSDQVKIKGDIIDYKSDWEKQVGWFDSSRKIRFGVLLQGKELKPVSEEGQVDFLGLQSAADAVVYLIDASGSIVANFDLPQVELLRSVRSLQPTQSFGVIFFRNERMAAYAQGKLVHATEDEKNSLEEFIKKIHPEDRTNPIPAIRIAFRMLHGSSARRKGIYLLTDGCFPEDQQVIRFIREQNSGKKIQINTLLLGIKTPDAEKVLQQIAKENGGKFSFISTNE